MVDCNLLILDYQLIQKLFYLKKKHLKIYLNF